MRSLTQNEFKSLAEYRAAWCVSIYMPTDPARLQNRKDVIRLRNLLVEVGNKLQDKGMRQPDVEKMLTDANALAADSDFWRDQRGGLALFISPDHFSHYELDFKFTQFCIVAERFHLKPLINADRKSDLFFVFALSQNNVQLFKGGDESLEKVKLMNVPLSLEEALQFEEGGKQLQHHVVPRARGGGGQAIYHGHGSVYPDDKDSITHFFQKLDQGVCNQLKNEKLPMVLVGVDFIRALYAQTSEYPLLMKDGISGSLESMDLKTLSARARKIVQPYYQIAEKKAVENYHQNHVNMKTSDVLEIILPAAVHGQIETLFLREEGHLWGRFDEDTSKVTIHSERDEDSEDLIDLACVLTLVNGGEVFFLPEDQMPEGNELAATFYYELEKA